MKRQTYLIPLTLFLLAFCVSAAELELTDDSVLIQYGDVALTVADFEVMAQRIPPGDRANVYGQAGRILKDLDDLMVTHILADNARKREIDQQSHLRAQVRMFEEQLLSEMMIRAHIADLPPPDWDVLIEERYVLQQERFVVPESAQASHILVTQANGPDPLAEANKLRERLESGESFETLAKEYSQDRGSAAQGGLLPMTAKGRFEPAFDKYVFEAEIGALSEPVRTRYGYHLIVVNERTAARQQPLDEVRSGIRKTVQEEWELAQRREYVEGLRVAKKDINHEAIEQLVREYAPNATIKRKN